MVLAVAAVLCVTVLTEMPVGCAGLAIGGWMLEHESCSATTVNGAGFALALCGLVAFVVVDSMVLHSMLGDKEGRRSVVGVAIGVVVTAVAQVWCCWAVPCLVSQWL